MERTEEAQGYLELGKKYLRAATVAFDEGIYEPALANSIHALELASKAALFVKVEGPLKTHNVGGLFAQHYSRKVGKDICHQLNRILNKYNIPRYPEEPSVDIAEVAEVLEFAKQFLEEVEDLLIKP